MTFIMVYALRVLTEMHEAIIGIILIRPLPTITIWLCNVILLHLSGWISNLNE